MIIEKEKEELVQYIKILISKLKKIKRTESERNQLFYHYESLFEIVDDESLEFLSIEERSVYFWFAIYNLYYPKIKNKKIIMDFLENIDFYLGDSNYLNKERTHSIQTTRLIKWLKLNLNKEELSDILNKALSKTDKVWYSVNIFDLEYLNIKGQETKFNITDLMEDFYNNFEEKYKDLKSTPIILKKLNKILIHDDLFIKKGIEYFNDLNACRRSGHAFILINYNKDTDYNINFIYKMICHMSKADCVLLLSNESLMNDLISFNNISSSILDLYESLYIKLNKKELFDYFFKESIKHEKAFVLAPYSYLIKKLTVEERKKYVEKLKYVKTETELRAILVKILNPLDLLKLRLFQEGFGNIKLLSIKERDIKILKYSITEDLKISDNALKLLKINHSC